MYSIPFRCGASEARTRLIAFNDLEFAQQLKWKAPNESTPTIGVNGCCGMAMHQLAADLLNPPLHAALLAENTPWKLPIMEAVIRQTAAHTGRAVPPDAVFEPLDVHQVDEIPRQLYRINNGRRSTLGFGDPPCKAASTSNRTRNKDAIGHVGAVRHAIEVSASSWVANINTPTVNSYTPPPAHPISSQSSDSAFASHWLSRIHIRCDALATGSECAPAYPTSFSFLVVTLPYLLWCKRDVISFVFESNKIPPVCPQVRCHRPPSVGR